MEYNRRKNKNTNVLLEQIMNLPSDKIDKVPYLSTIYRMIHAGKIGKTKRRKNVLFMYEKGIIKNLKAYK